MSKLTLEQACTIIDAVLAEGLKRGMKPLSVAVVDDGGHLIAFKKDDHSSVFRFDIAVGKAYSSVGMHRSSRSLEQLALARPHFGMALATASGGRFVPVAGGNLIKDPDGMIVGAVGVTGCTSDNDEIAALAGIAAAGMAGE